MISMDWYWAARLLEVHAKRALTGNDRSLFESEVRKRVQECGAIRLLFVMQYYLNCEVSGSWQDIELRVCFREQVERMAFVGNRRWQFAVSSCCSDFTLDRVRYFCLDEIAQARAWLTSGQVIPLPGPLPVPHAS